MLVQVLTNANNSIHDPIVQNCCLRVDVCTQGGDENWTTNIASVSNQTMVQGYFVPESSIDTMAKNRIDYRISDNIWSKMNQYDIWMT